MIIGGADGDRTRYESVLYDRVVSDSIPTHDLSMRPLSLFKQMNWVGGAERDRTVGLLNAIQALSQLSYSPTAQKSNMEKREMSK